VNIDLERPWPPLVVVVGAGGVGKTTLAAALGLTSAEAGHDTLVMTFDPSRRLKDALGVEAAAGRPEVDVASGTKGRLRAGLLDARETFDGLVERYSASPEARDRILENPVYDHMAGHLGGVLEYMAVERLYEVANRGDHARVILDTPPTREAIDFLEAPQRIVDFLDSGALKIALRPWFDSGGHLRATRGLSARLGFVDRGLEKFLDRVVGLELLRGMSEFFRAFEPLFAGFRERAERVRNLLAEAGTVFILVAGPGEENIPDTLFFARRLVEAGYHLGPVVVNRVHPVFPEGKEGSEGARLFHWLGERHRRALTELRRRLTDRHPLVALPLTAHEPTDLASLAAFGRDFQERLSQGDVDPG
jgi:anion-transporting  ArsA/GET3 family ATPase